MSKNAAADWRRSQIDACSLMPDLVIFTVVANFCRRKRDIGKSSLPARGPTDVGLVGPAEP
jgi:hypothetical protein